MFLPVVLIFPFFYTSIASGSTLGPGKHRDKSQVADSTSILRNRVLVSSAPTTEPKKVTIDTYLFQIVAKFRGVGPLVTILI